MRNFFRFIYPTERFKYELGLASPGGAGRNRVLSKEDFLEITVKMPSLDEQQKIADFLSAIDDKIQLEERRLAEAKKFKKSLLQQMFV